MKEAQHPFTAHRLSQVAKVCACRAQPRGAKDGIWDMKHFPVGHVETRTGINGLLCDFTFQHNGTKSGSIPFGPHWLETMFILVGVL